MIDPCEDIFIEYHKLIKTAMKEELCFYKQRLSQIYVSMYEEGQCL